MTDTFFSLGLTREQLVDLHHALLRQHIMEDTFRRERDEPTKEPPALLTHIERLLGLSPEESHQQFHEEEDQLWEYSWYAYTDEWAWYRARQEVEKELGIQLQLTSAERVEHLIEEEYERSFDRYTKEIDMAHGSDTDLKKKPSSRRTKK